MARSGRLGAPRHLAVAIVVAGLGIAGSVGVWHTMRALEDEVAATSFQRDAKERCTAIRARVEIALETLRSLASLFRSSDGVSRRQFREFTTPLLARHVASIQAFGWNRRILAADREAHEQAGRTREHPDYQITERDADGGMVRARARDEYVAVSYLEPFSGNEKALGYDIASETTRRRALQMADASGKLTITAPVRLVQDGRKHPHGFLACMPIRTEGFVVGVYRAGDIVQGALDDFDRLDLAIRLRDANDADGPDLFAQAVDAADRDSGLRFAPPIAYGGRTWILDVRPTQAYLAVHRTWMPLAALLVGLLLTALLTAYSAALLGRSARVEALVVERTEALTQANAGLAREVAQRERAEQQLTRHRDQLEDAVRRRTTELTGVVTQLQESEERNRLTLDAIADGAWDWDVPSGACRYSAGWLSSLGYTPEDVEPHIGLRDGLVHPDDAASAQRALAFHLDGQSPRYESKLRLRRADGTWRWTLARGRVVGRDAEGRPLRMVGTDTDITERVEAEEEQRGMEQRLQHSQKLESLGVLAGGIAHDFNNLLVVMLGGAELALQSTPRTSPAFRSLENIRVSATRAAELTEQMLAYAGRNTIARQQVDLPELVEEMARLLRASKSKKADLRIERDSAVPPVSGDATQLRQVVMNLITNASDAIGDGAGTITLRIGTVSVGAQELAAMVLGDKIRPGEYVSLEVADSGVGMAPATVEKIFDPFFTTKFQGRGLGLAAVLGIIRGHDGAIHVASRPGQGTTFRVLLPCVGRVETPEAPETRAQAGGAGGAVLVVDDEDFVRRIARDILEGAGFRVLEAEDGPEGIEILRARPRDIALVVLDMTMPRMSGTEAIRALHRIRPDVPVVFSSGYSETEAAEAVAEYGAAGFIKKPYGVRTFLTTVHDALRSARAEEHRQNPAPRPE